MFYALGPSLLSAKKTSVNGINQSTGDEEEEKQDMKDLNHKF